MAHKLISKITNALRERFSTQPQHLAGYTITDALGWDKKDEQSDPAVEGWGLALKPSVTIPRMGCFGLFSSGCGVAAWAANTNFYSSIPYRPSASSPSMLGTYSRPPAGGRPLDRQL